MKSKKSILILQNTILHYRIPFYEKLADYYEVTVLHSGKKVNNSKFHEIIVKVKKVGPFFLQSEILTEVRNKKFDYIIAMFDLRWIFNILASYFYNTNAKFIWWGAWLTNSAVANFVRTYLSKKHNSILYTKEAKESFENAGVNPKLLYVANNTFDVGERIKAYESPVKDSILFVGSLDTRKELKIVLVAFSRVIAKIEGLKFHIIGDGGEIKNLKNLSIELGISENVLFHGHISDTKVLKKFYEKAIVSVSHGQAGLAVLQSLGYGVPFITKINAISGGEKSNIRDGYNGFFCEDDIESLSGKLLTITSDLEFAKKMGKNAYEYYSEYCTIDNMVQGFRDAIENTRMAN